MDEIAWDTVHGEFAFDGSWRDIYVLGTNLDDWQRMLDAVRSANYELAYVRDDHTGELPSKIEDTFPLPNTCGRELNISFANVVAKCLFSPRRRSSSSSTRAR